MLTPRQGSPPCDSALPRSFRKSPVTPVLLSPAKILSNSVGPAPSPPNLPNPPKSPKKNQKKPKNFGFVFVFRKKCLPLRSHLGNERHRRGRESLQRLNLVKQMNKICRRKIFAVPLQNLSTRKRPAGLDDRRRKERTLKFLQWQSSTSYFCDRGTDTGWRRPTGRPTAPGSCDREMSISIQRKLMNPTKRKMSRRSWRRSVCWLRLPGGPRAGSAKARQNNNKVSFAFFWREKRETI